MFDIKLEENSYKIIFRALPVKIQQSKNRQGEGARSTMCPPFTPEQIGLNSNFIDACLVFKIIEKID